MLEFHTELELGGAMRETLVSYEWDQGRPLIDTVELCRSERVDYDDKGEFSPHVEYHYVDVTNALDPWQFFALAKEIMDDALYQDQDQELVGSYLRAA